MDADRSRQQPEDEPLGRPFLGALTDSQLPAPTSDTTRPYVLTGGRTSADTPTVAIETIITAQRGTRQATQHRGSPVGPVNEMRAILELCQWPHSVAEVAAHLRLPLGVVQVLVADLMAEGMLSASSTGSTIDQLAQDVAFIERLIAGVASL